MSENIRFDRAYINVCRIFLVLCCGRSSAFLRCTFEPFSRGNAMKFTSRPGASSSCSPTPTLSALRGAASAVLASCPGEVCCFFFLQNYCSDPKFIFVRRYTYQFERLNTSNWVAQQVVSFPVQSRSTLQNPEGPDDFFSACAIIFHIVLFGTLYSLCGFRTEYVGSFRTCLLFTPVSSSKTSRRYLMIIIAPGSS